jgi:hypothetical protein
MDMPFKGNEWSIGDNGPTAIGQSFVVGVWRARRIGLQFSSEQPQAGICLLRKASWVHDMPDKEFLHIHSPNTAS